MKGRRYFSDIRIAPNWVKKLSLTPEAIHAELHDFEKRLAWDPNIVRAEWLHNAGSEQPKILRYRTRAAAGGIISSREFVDASMLFRQEDGIITVVTRWDEELGLLCKRGVQRAFNAPG